MILAKGFSCLFCADAIEAVLTVLEITSGGLVETDSHTAACLGSSSFPSQYKSCTDTCGLLTLRTNPHLSNYSFCIAKSTCSRCFFLGISKFIIK